MVYVIAAYSITVGALGLYAVILRHRLRWLGASLAAGGDERIDPRRGFNVGAALLAPFWMFVHGMRLPGAALLALSLAMVPLYAQAMWTVLLMVALVPVAAGTALGFVGNRIGVAHTGLDDAAAFSASQLPWAVAGIVLYAVVLPWAWYFAASPA